MTAPLAGFVTGPVDGRAPRMGEGPNETSNGVPNGVPRDGATAAAGHGPQQATAKGLQNGAAFGTLALAASEITCLFGIALVVSTALLGGWFVDLVLGAKYAGLTPLLVWLAVGQSLRGMKTGTAITALAQAQTGNAMLANLLRVAVLPLAWALLAGGGDLRALLLLSLLGELAGAALALWLQRRRQGVPIAPLAPLLLITGLSHLLLLAWVELDRPWPLLALASGLALLAPLCAPAFRRLLRPARPAAPNPAGP